MFLHVLGVARSTALGDVVCHLELQPPLHAQSLRFSLPSEIGGLCFISPQVLPFWVPPPGSLNQVCFLAVEFLANFGHKILVEVALFVFSPVSCRLSLGSGAPLLCRTACCRAASPIHFAFVSSAWASRVISSSWLRPMSWSLPLVSSSSGFVG